jgi:hypothetical protein
MITRFNKFLIITFIMIIMFLTLYFIFDKTLLIAVFAVISGLLVSITYLISKKEELSGKSVMNLYAGADSQIGLFQKSWG